MKNRQSHTLFCLLLWGVLLASCQHRPVSRLLHSAESLIWENPDSVLKILAQVPSPQKLTGQEQADYALLLTQAQYRSNILAPSDSLINIAVDYYKESRDANRKGAAYLYKGGVLSELKQSEEAIQAYKQAEECIPKMTDMHLIARIYSDLGYLNQLTLNTDIAKSYYKKSLFINQSEENLTNAAKDLINLMGIYVLFDDHERQDSVEWCISELLNIIPKVDANLQAKIYHNIAVQNMYKNRYVEADNYLQKVKEVSNGKLSYKALSVWGKLYTLMGHKEKADSLLQAALKTSDLNIKVNIYSSLQKRAEEERQYEKAMEYLKKHVEAVDTIRKRAEHTKLRELQMKYDKSVALQQNAEIRLKWYLTITIGALILIALVIAYFYSLKLYRKRKEKELFQQKQAAFKLQERIDALQVMVEEKESSHQQEREDVLHEMGILQKEREDALHEITALQNEKEEKEVRVKQLEAMFCAKGIAVAVADAEALQAFLKITEHGEYVPAESRGSLRHWLDITHRQFATRLHEEYPSLTGRETDICYLAALGFSLDAVADLLGVQPRSIERYISRTCEKVGFDKGGKEVFSDFVMGYAHKKGK